jgi:hypothetical protein
MGKIEGFNLLKYIPETSLNYYNFSDGMIKRNPSLKYRYIKINPLDPTDIWKIGKYYLDKFKLTTFLIPEEYDDLLMILDECSAEGVEFRLEYTHGQNAGGGYKTKQFIITKVPSMPDCEDDLHEYREKVEFELESVYYSLPPLIGDIGIYVDNPIYI